MELQNIVRDILLIVITLLSVKYTNSKVRSENGFTWFPITEVAKLFIGIFITIIPVLTILSQDGGLYSGLKIYAIMT